MELQLISVVDESTLLPNPVNFQPQVNPNMAMNAWQFQQQQQQTMFNAGNTLPYQMFQGNPYFN